MRVFLLQNIWTEIVIRRYTGQPSIYESGAESYDNAYAENLFSRYKAELLEGGAFSDVGEARLETFHYIVGYYNWVRRHSSLGYVSPEKYEREWVEEQAGKSSNILDEKKGVKVKTHSCRNF